MTPKKDPTHSDYQRCGNCQLPDFEHGKDGSCLFAPTKFRSMTPEEWARWFGGMARTLRETLQ